MRVTAAGTKTKKAPRKSRRKWKTILGGLLVLLLIAAVWITISRNPYAQGLRAIFGRTPDQAIIDHTFTVGAHGFRFYKFSLPEGSAHMAVVGHFSASADTGDKTIDVLVLTEEQFGLWQTGAQSQAVYASGKVPEGEIQSDLPTGSGTFYLVFDNKFSTSTAKKVTAAFLLRHKNWWR